MRTVSAILAASCVAVVVGCAGGPERDYAQTYPSQKRIGPTLDIQVLRGQGEITMTNASGRAFGPVNMWLNQWYVLPIDGLEVGETKTIRLDRFIDEHGERFRVGGFFATKAPERLVLAQFETEEEMVGLIVVRPREER